MDTEHPSAGAQPLETVVGVVEEVSFANEDTGFAVLWITPQGATENDDPVKAVGNLSYLQPGEEVQLTGTWVEHAEYGPQFKVTTAQKIMPATSEGLRRYLSSGAIEGIGPVLANRLVDLYGEDTLQALADVEQLQRVRGIGRARAIDVTRSWQAQTAVHDSMVFLEGHGIGPGLAWRVYKRYGQETIRRVRADPYCLVEVHGIGFPTADRIAMSLGVARDAPSRLQAAALHVLGDATGQGHVYLPRPELVRRAARLLSSAPEPVEGAIDALAERHAIVVEDVPVQGEAGPTGPGVYLLEYHWAEESLSECVHNLQFSPDSRLPRFRTLREWEPLFAEVRALPGMVELSEQQQQALRMALTRKVTILTGGPGTGKTTTMRALIALLEHFNYTYVLASPTGRAAKRLSEVTDRPAGTVHRLLGFTGEEFTRDEFEPLEAAMVIVDEASMLDVQLAAALFRAVRPDTHVLLVGDADQLPSVGAGNVLRDLIASGSVAIIRLETIFRQAAQSLIIVNSHHVRRGEMLETPADATDFYFVERQRPEGLVEVVVEMVAARIPARFGLDPRRDVQVMAPMYKGTAGIDELNRALQARLNPPAPDKDERKLGSGRVLRAGDRVMQLRNDYEREVYNGDIGHVLTVERNGQRVTVDVDGRIVEYEQDALDDLTLAWAVSIHKAQGAEYPAVVIALHNQHYRLLGRNVLYTAITRARKLAVIAGMRQAVATAVANNTVAARWSALAWRLGPHPPTPFS